jgi:hypothetical protein
MEAGKGDPHPPYVVSFSEVRTTTPTHLSCSLGLPDERKPTRPRKSVAKSPLLSGLERCRVLLGLGEDLLEDLEGCAVRAVTVLVHHPSKSNRYP